MSFVQSLIAATTLSPRSSTNPGGRNVALIVSLVIIGVVMIAGVMYYTFRLRRQEVTENTWYPLSRSATLVEPRHIASRITPFGTRSHEPGQNMRVANRRSNGVWEFTNPDGTFNPSGIGDMDVKPASRKPSKARMAKAEMKLPTRGYLDVEALAYPPPAYGAHE